ncbi:MAG: erythromycin esterase family protein [Halobacterium sp.]
MTADDTTTAQHADALAEYATELRTIDPDAPRDDLAAVGDRLAASRYVGLGEATHGTREFFQFKHRLLAHLVADRGVRAVALEANFSEALALDDYVVHGDGDPRDALDGVYFWTWNVESVLALLEWLRAFNDDRPLEDRVRFLGVDAQYTAGPTQALTEFFADADPEFLDAVREDLDAADDDGVPPQQDDGADTRVAAADRVASRIRDRLDDRRDDYAAATSERRVELARQHCRVLAQAADYKRHFPDDVDDTDDVTYARVRDEAMADNAEWVRAFTDTDCLPVWAHDAHVARTGLRYGDGAPSLGQHLADRHGDDYHAVGFAFARGGFEAYDTAPDTETALVEHVIDDPQPDTIEAALDRLPLTAAVLDLRDAREDDRLADWLADRPHFATGAAYDRTSPGDCVDEYDYTAAFDALAYVAETTRARPLDDSP